jgi:hypothetical protein
MPKKEELSEENLTKTTSGWCCRPCTQIFKFNKCKKCGVLIFEDDGNNQNICEECLDEMNFCEECGEELISCVVTADERLLCPSCYNSLRKKCGV